MATAAGIHYPQSILFLLAVGLVGVAEQRNIRLSEAPSHGLPVLLYDPDSRGALNYMQLAKEIIDKE